jgi:hypothetical protein
VEKISRTCLSQIDDLVDSSRKSDKNIVRNQQSTIKADNEAVQEFSETLQVELDKVFLHWKFLSNSKKLKFSFVSGSNWP